MKLRNDLNFSGGPGALPDSVLKQVQASIIELPDVGLSILGISHRSEWFKNIVQETESNIRTLLGLGENYHVLFLQGGATQQFSMIPMALTQHNKNEAEYLHTGYWSAKAIESAKNECPTRVIWSGKEVNFTRLPHDEELSYSADAPFLHYVSNETVEGLQFNRVLGLDSVPRVCDMSSDFLSRPIEADRFSVIYAHAQKNIGPAGVTVVILRDDLLDESYPGVPGFLNYHNHINSNSIYNTPPVFSIYVVLLITRWLLNDMQGLQGMQAVNQQKARLMYQVLDSSEGFYRGRAEAADRSLMNAVFNLATPDMEKQFVSEAAKAGFSGLSGHRSVGGIRASLYNGMTVAAVEELVGFMDDFKNVNSR